METTRTIDVREVPRAIRISAGLTQEDVAERAPAAIPTLSKLERGDDVNYGTIRRVARVLGVDAAYLAGSCDYARALKASRRMFRARMHKQGNPLAKYAATRKTEAAR